jgi:NADH-quinone oxidoreductase subunit B
MGQETLQDFGGVWLGKLSELVRTIVGSGPVKFVVNWSRMYALWPVHLTTACCSAEFGAMMSPRLDPERFGLQSVAGGLRQCDLIIVEGTVTKKMAKRLKIIYEQMATPRYVVAMGDCACSGGLFHDSYSIVNDVHKIIPIDVYIPGCPPRPEALLSAIVKLREKIRRQEVFAQ